MRRGICVKCGNAEIYGIQAHGGPYQNLWLGGHTAFSAPSTHYLACASCGYTEQYVNPDKLGELRQRGTRMTPPR